jgi:hypothetical protein
MRPQREREIAGDYARWVADQQHAQIAVDDDMRAHEVAKIAAEHPHDFPFAVLLGILVACAVAIAGARSPARTGVVVTRGLLVRAMLAAAIGLGAVIAIASLG